MKKQTGAHHLVEALTAQGTDRVYCVPGESFLAVLDALHARRDAIETITCRHEGGAAMMAEADGKLTGRPGVCMVTRGPGATNASAGIHVAMQDSTPMILFIGQVARRFTGREAFQEVDFTQVFGTMAKWVAQIEDAARIPEFVARAYAVAMAGRPGPVVLALPEDMLADEVEAPDVPCRAPVEIHPDPERLSELAALLRAAERPIAVVGGSRWDEGAVDAMERFAGAWDLPVAASWRRQDHFDNAHPCYAGEAGLGLNPRLRARLGEADLVLLLGDRLGEIASDGYTILSVPRPRQRLVHIHADAAELGRIYQADLSINATPNGFVHALAALPVPAGPARWSRWRAEARVDYERWQQPRPSTDRFDFGKALVWLREHLPDGAILTNGAGNFAAWVHRFHRYRGLGTQLAPMSGSMGYGVPAAVAAKLRRPDRAVICFAGDGDFLMTGQELATAMQYGAAVVFVVIDNGMYGTIRMHQERRYPGNVWATDLRNPDFAALARAFGAEADLVEETEAFGPAVLRALASGRTTLIHVRTNPETISASSTIAELREQARRD